MWLWTVCCFVCFVKCVFASCLQCVCVLFVNYCVTLSGFLLVFNGVCVCAPFNVYACFVCDVLCGGVWCVFVLVFCC